MQVLHAPCCSVVPCRPGGPCGRFAAEPGHLRLQVGQRPAQLCRTAREVLALLSVGHDYKQLQRMAASGQATA